MNNFLQSVQDSESVVSYKLSQKPRKIFGKQRGSKGSKQIIIEGTSSSFVTDSEREESMEDQEAVPEEDENDFMIQAPDNKVVREIYRTSADQAVAVGITDQIDDEIMEKCFNLGIAQVLNKPIKQEDMKKLVQLFN